MAKKKANATDFAQIKNNRDVGFDHILIPADSKRKAVIETGFLPFERDHEIPAAELCVNNEKIGRYSVFESTKGKKNGHYSQFKGDVYIILNGSTEFTKDLLGLTRLSIHPMILQFVSNIIESADAERMLIEMALPKCWAGTLSRMGSVARHKINLEFYTEVPKPCKDDDEIEDDDQNDGPLVVHSQWPESSIEED